MREVKVTIRTMIDLGVKAVREEGSDPMEAAAEIIEEAWTHNMISVDAAKHFCALALAGLIEEVLSTPDE